MKKDQVKSEVEVLHLFRWFTRTHTHTQLFHIQPSHTHTTLSHATLSYGIRTSFSQSAFHHLHRTHTYFFKYIVTTLSHTQPSHTELSHPICLPPSPSSFLPLPSRLHLSFATYWKKLTCGVIRSLNFRFAVEIRFCSCSFCCLRA